MRTPNLSPSRSDLATEAEWRAIVEALWDGAESIIVVIGYLQASDEPPSTVAIAAGLRFDAMRQRVEALVAKSK